jgi:hypothetical protein
VIAPSELRPTPPLVDLAWLSRREQLDVAHAFRVTGPAWHWSLCNRVRFTAGLDAPAADAVQCSVCELVANGTPGELSEAYGR